MTRRKKNTLRRLIESVRRAAPSFARYAAWLGQRFRSAVLRRLGPPVNSGLFFPEITDLKFPR
jgi:hypothetical protein